MLGVNVLLWYRAEGKREKERLQCGCAVTMDD